MGDTLEFGSVFIEEMGALLKGRMRLADNGIQFKNEKTGKVTNGSSSDFDLINWQRLGNKPGIRFSMSDGTRLRFGGFKDTDYDRVKNFASQHWSKDVEQQELFLKGWNYGNCQTKGQSIDFTFEDRPLFEIPISNVNNCLANKSEATLEFHQNEDCPVSLMEMRFHMPNDPDDEDADPVEEFRKAVLAFAGMETESGQAIVTLPQVLCTTPRGRYDIKIYPNHLSLHGKTYDYKIPIKTITRLFLVPHKDGRHVFFVISLNPPIRQGQTRYHYLVLEFAKDETADLELGLTDEQIEKEYGGKLEKEMPGLIYESVSKLFRVMMGMKISVPGSFNGHSGTPAIQCAHKQASGFLYPLEKGFLYIHKPPMYIRFEEVSEVHFARSDVSTRTFDFEIEQKSGQTLIFNSVEKDEYNKLFGYVQSKHLRIRNAKKLTSSIYAEDKFAGSDDEIDPYKAAVKAEGAAAGESESDSEDEDYDLDHDLKKREANKASDEGSGSEPDEEFDSDDSGSGGSSGSGSGEEEEEEEERPKKKAKESKPKKVKDDDDEGGKKKGKKAKKDPNAPKRATTAYFIWMQENRSSIKKDGDSVADTAKRAGEMWKTMSADDKVEYEKKAKKDKERYEEEMREYKRNGGGTASSPAPKSSKKSSSSSKKATGPSPSKAKSKEYISDSDGSDASEKPTKKPKKAAKEEKEESPETPITSDSD